MLLVPVGTDRPLQRTPWINYFMIAANVLIFLQSYSSLGGGSIRGHYAAWQLTPSDPVWTQFIGYQFLHVGWAHLLGNMAFLLILGNHVNGRLGHPGYLAFYLAGGIASGIGHTLFNLTPCVGASGAVCAVTGAYLVLFPRTRVTLFFWIYFYVDTFTVSSLWLISFQFMENLIMSVTGLGGAVAYEAHLFGYLFGFLISLALLLAGMLARDHVDLVDLLRLPRYRVRKAWEQEQIG